VSVNVKLVIVTISGAMSLVTIIELIVHFIFVP